ncbi:MAG: hypothetical protein M1G31_03500 [Pseudanabaena sp. Salubria-1]|nr:hypothetical protein [Pseudanabaena sp. Salubria-1]
MASLMKEFAEARQIRLQGRAVFLAEQQLAREQRSSDLQAQAEATATYLAHAEETRLAWEHGRQVIAENALESRREEVLNRAAQVSEYLGTLNVTRTEQAAEDSEQRAQEVRTRTFKTRSQLKHIRKARIRDGEASLEQRQQLRKARIRDGEASLEQRQQLVQDRAALTKMQLEDLTKTRLDNATIDAQQRAQEFSDRAANVKASLAQIESSRLADAEAQAFKLKAFRSQLTNSVWSGDRATVANPPVANLSQEDTTRSPDASEISTSKPKKKNPKSESVVASAPEPAIAKPIEVKETPKPAGKIEQFVVDYVAQLSTNSSLLEVVNDRDTVRDLLAQGANTLKVDPSDILNTLLQMAEGSST